MEDKGRERGTRTTFPPAARALTCQALHTKFFSCHCLARKVIFPFAVWLGCTWAGATVINVGPGDTYTKIESAQPGDEVVIAPRTYAFRIYPTKQATATNPIAIRAQNPANPPAWDFGSTLVENAPGQMAIQRRTQLSDFWNRVPQSSHVVEE